MARLVSKRFMVSEKLKCNQVKLARRFSKYFKQVGPSVLLVEYSGNYTFTHGPRDFKFFTPHDSEHLAFTTFTHDNFIDIAHDLSLSDSSDLTSS